MAEDWDLYAIVRSCTSATSTATSSPVTENHPAINPLDCLAALTFDDEDIPFSFPNLEQPRNSGLQELQDSYKPFLASTSTGQGNILSSSSASDCGALSGQNQPQVVLQHQFPRNQQQPFANMSMSPRLINYSQQHVEPHQNQRARLHPLGTNSASNASSRPMQSQSPRSRKKKSNQKRLVVHVTAENLANDVWAWRKYGQKPIKGSPYPRNYYRCSSSKGCSARKQVEKSNTDPNMYIVSYTGDHTHPRPTHRNSLAGSTRSKFPATEKSADKESDTSFSGDQQATSLSPRTPLSTDTIDPQAAPVNDHNHNNIRTEARNADIAGADNMDGHAIIESDGDDFDDDDDDNDGNALIPNMALSEDIIKELQELC